jgi:hypothetical protein
MERGRIKKGMFFQKRPFLWSLITGWCFFASVSWLWAFHVDMHTLSESSFCLDYPVYTGAYYQVWVACQPAGPWVQVRDMHMGATGTYSWVDAQAAEVTNTLFYRVRSVPLSAPEDYDGDGMDDVYELGYPFLSPLDAGDAWGDEDEDGLTNQDEHDLGTDPGNADTDGDGWGDASDPRPLTRDDDPIINSLQLSATANRHSEGEILVVVDAFDPAGGDLEYQFLLNGELISEWQEASQTVYQAESGGALHVLTAQVRDIQGDISQKTNEIYIFRTPPRL